MGFLEPPIIVLDSAALEARRHGERLARRAPSVLYNARQRKDKSIKARLGNE